MSCSIALNFTAAVALLAFPAALGAQPSDTEPDRCEGFLAEVRKEYPSTPTLARLEGDVFRARVLATPYLWDELICLAAEGADEAGFAYLSWVDAGLLEFVDVAKTDEDDTTGPFAQWLLMRGHASDTMQVLVLNGERRVTLEPKPVKDWTDRHC